MSDHIFPAPSRLNSTPHTHSVALATTTQTPPVETAVSVHNLGKTRTYHVRRNSHSSLTSPNHTILWMDESLHLRNPGIMIFPVSTHKQGFQPWFPSGVWTSSIHSTTPLGHIESTLLAVEVAFWWPRWLALRPSTRVSCQPGSASKTAPATRLPAQFQEFPSSVLRLAASFLEPRLKTILGRSGLAIPPGRLMKCPTLQPLEIQAARTCFCRPGSRCCGRRENNAFPNYVVWVDGQLSGQSGKGD